MPSKGYIKGNKIDIQGEYAIVHLDKGATTVIDTNDVELVKQYT